MITKVNIPTVIASNTRYAFDGRGCENARVSNHRPNIPLAHLVRAVIDLIRRISVLVQSAHPHVQTRQCGAQNTPRQVMAAGVLGVDPNALGIRQRLAAVRDIHVAGRGDRAVDVDDTCVDDGGVCGVGVQWG